MTTTMNNLEKLFQIAAMEQMFELMQKMKNDMNYDSSVLNFTKNDQPKSDELKNDSRVDKLVNQIADLNILVTNISLKYQVSYDIINELSLKVKTLENELSEIKTDKEHNNQYICAQVRGQQLLTSYPGFSKEPSNSKGDENENIKLKIEERHVTAVEELEPELKSEPIIDHVVDISDDDASVSEDEVGTEDGDQLEIKEQVDEDAQEQVEDEVEEEVEDEVEEEVEDEVEDEDEEEVFEIEIDDVTYFATDEENGILYEVTKDGEVGKKVGIIKDGEPIFT